MLTLPAITGQDRAIAQLGRAYASGRMAHAYLFTGPRGAGKRTTAEQVAQFLLCPRRGAAACGQCPSCRKFAAGGHPDFYRLEPAGKGLRPAIKIEAVRELRQRLTLKPLEGERVVVVIDEAEALTTEAANALLKTLEEPPEFALFLLTCTATRDLPATIASRCQRIAFAPRPADALDPEFVAAWRPRFDAFLSRYPKITYAEIGGLVEALLKEEGQVAGLLELLRRWCRERLQHPSAAHWNYERLFRFWDLVQETDQALAGHVYKKLAWERMFLELT